MLLLSPSKARKAASAGIVAFKLLLEGANTILGGIPLLLLPKWMTEGGWTLPLQQYYCIGEPFPFQTSLRSSLYSSFPARTHNWLWQQLMHCTAVSLKRGKKEPTLLLLLRDPEAPHYSTKYNRFQTLAEVRENGSRKPLPSANFAILNLCRSSSPYFHWQLFWHFKPTFDISPSLVV